MHKALKVGCTATGTLSVVSQATAGFSPIVTPESISSPSLSRSIEDEDEEYGEKEIGYANNESDIEENTCRDDDIEQEKDDDDEQPLIPSLL